MSELSSIEKIKKEEEQNVSDKQRAEIENILKESPFYKEVPEEECEDLIERMLKYIQQQKS